MKIGSRGRYRSCRKRGEQWLSEPRSYSANRLSQKLAAERQVHLGAEQIRRILKKKLALEKTKKQTTTV